VQSAELSDQARDALTAVADQARAQGLTVEVGGDVLQIQPEQGATEVIGVVVAALVLVITFGSLVAAGLPLLTALLGIGISVAAITAASGRCCATACKRCTAQPSSYPDPATIVQTRRGSKSDGSSSARLTRERSARWLPRLAARSSRLYGR